MLIIKTLKAHFVNLSRLFSEQTVKSIFYSLFRGHVFNALFSADCKSKTYWTHRIIS